MSYSVKALTLRPRTHSMHSINVKIIAIIKSRENFLYAGFKKIDICLV